MGNFTMTILLFCGVIVIIVLTTEWPKQKPVEVNTDEFCLSRGGVLHVGPGKYSRPVFCVNGEHTHKFEGKTK